ncbi:hypothetical protein BKA62DRAFT_775915 [Auriculariales sp. MPI-PUGE-AT-0066]|nr:hypothetical protein BKA62DRAFT_775915 [Auriculariales sp. MPI-PUGE-AT-0066]
MAWHPGWTPSRPQPIFSRSTPHGSTDYVTDSTWRSPLRARASIKGIVCAARTSVAGADRARAASARCALALPTYPLPAPVVLTSPLPLRAASADRSSDVVLALTSPLPLRAASADPSSDVVQTGRASHSYTMRRCMRTTGRSHLLGLHPLHRCTLWRDVYLFSPSLFTALTYLQTLRVHDWTLGTTYGKVAVHAVRHSSPSHLMRSPPRRHRAYITGRRTYTIGRGPSADRDPLPLCKRRSGTVMVPQYFRLFSLPFPFLLP